MIVDKPRELRFLDAGIPMGHVKRVKCKRYESWRDCLIRYVKKPKDRKYAIAEYDKRIKIKNDPPMVATDIVIELGYEDILEVF